MKGFILSEYFQNWLNIFMDDSVFLWGGEISPNFNLKNMISSCTKDFHGKIGLNLPDFEEKKSNCEIFYDKFQ